MKRHVVIGILHDKQAAQTGDTERERERETAKYSKWCIRVYVWQARGRGEASENGN